MNARNWLVPNLLLPVGLIGAMALGHLCAPRLTLGSATIGFAPDAAFGLARPASEQARKALVPCYARTLRAEYRTAAMLRTWRLGLPPGSDTRWADATYAENAMAYNAAAGLYPEAVGRDTPRRISLTIDSAE